LFEIEKLWQWLIFYVNGKFQFYDLTKPYRTNKKDNDLLKTKQSL